MHMDVRGKKLRRKTTSSLSLRHLTSCLHSDFSSLWRNEGQKVACERAKISPEPAQVSLLAG